MEEKVQNKYIFPNIMAKAMAKIDMRTQLEASLMSMTLILIGIVCSMLYMFIYTDFSIGYKIFLSVNGFAGFIFISSFLVTAFQQYQNYMKITQFQKENDDIFKLKSLKKNE